MCNNCGQLSLDYDVCEGCHKLLPEEPKYFWPDQAKVQRMEKPMSPGNAKILQVSNSRPGTLVLLDKKTFYGDKVMRERETGTSDQMVVSYHVETYLAGFYLNRGYETGKACSHHGGYAKKKSYLVCSSSVENQASRRPNFFLAVKVKR